MVAENEQETLYLDFKESSTGKAPMQESDRKTLAEAISGFANSDGGVIVWGVECHKGPAADDPDVAQSAKPIRNLSRWISDLNQYTHSSVSPEVVGVEHLSVPSDAGADVGYAVTYVPKADGQPRMAITRKKEQYCYFIRSGSSFVKMEAFMVADRFSRRPAPELALKVYLQDYTEDHSGGSLIRWYRIVVGISNRGIGIALYPALRLKLKEQLRFAEHGLDGGGRDGLDRRPQGMQNGVFYTGGVNHPIHPGTTLDVTNIVYTFHGSTAPNRWGNIVMDYELFCDGFSLVGTWSVPVTEQLLLSIPKDLSEHQQALK